MVVRQRVFDDHRQQSMMFTGKERDADTGLDYFGARWLTLNTLSTVSPLTATAKSNFNSANNQLITLNPAVERRVNRYNARRAEGKTGKVAEDASKYLRP